MKAVCTAGLLTIWGAVVFSKAFMEVGVVTALISWVLWHLQERKWDAAADKRFLWFLLAFFIWSALSYFWSEAPKQSARGIQKVGEQVLIFFLVTDVFRDRKSLSLWEKVFFAFCILAAVNGWFQFLTGKDFIRHFPMEHSGSGYRVSGSFKTYGLFANYLICVLPVLAGFAVHFYKKKAEAWRLAGILAIFFASLALLYLTRSRGAMLAFVAGGLFALIYQKNIKLLLAGVVAVGLVIAVMPKHELIHLDIERKEQSIVERVYLWDRALNVIKAKPLTGTGINTYAVAHQKYDTTQSWRVKNYYAHNGYLQMGAETGIPGVAIFVIFLLFYLFVTHQTLCGLAKARDTEFIYILGGLSVGVLNFLAMSMADTVMHNPPSIKFFWFLLAVHAAYLRLAKIQLEAAR